MFMDRSSLFCIFFHLDIFSLCLFNNAGFNMGFWLKYNIWKLSYFYGIIANILTSHCPTKENIPYVNDTVVYTRAKECLKSEFTTRENLLLFFFYVILRFHIRAAQWPHFFRVHLPPQTFFFSSQLFAFECISVRNALEPFQSEAFGVSLSCCEKKKQQLHELD